MGVRHDAFAFAGLDDEARAASAMNGFKTPGRIPGGRLNKSDNLNDGFLGFGGDNCARARKRAKKKQNPLVHGDRMGMPGRTVKQFGGKRRNLARPRSEC